MGYAIDPDAVRVAGQMVGQLVVTGVARTWSGADGCGAEQVATAMEELQTWFRAEWATLEDDLLRSEQDARYAAAVLGAADDAAARTARATAVVSGARRPV
ncbi:hypothetical protein [Cellulosimicrobium sp. NPDC055967]|uniref:hypothetical protein n=1 Tax=Cellulosimicrobium sp. NPDC055967 TaxID=3345670 RepID=UPI0035DAE1CF